MALIQNLTRRIFYDSLLKIKCQPFGQEGDTQPLNDVTLLRYGDHVEQLINLGIIKLTKGLTEAGKDIKTDEDISPIRDNDVYLSAFDKSLKDAIHDGDLQSGLGYIPENIANKGQPNGYAELDANTKVPSIRIPDTFKEIRVVANISERDLLVPFEGMRVHVLDNGDGKWAEYIWTGTIWILTGDKDTPFTGIIDWANISNKPTSLVADIDDAVSKRHVQNTDQKLDENGINETSVGEIRSHIDSTSNPHSTSLEQARSVNNTISGNINFNSNRALNLSQPTSNGEPIIYGNDGEVYFYDTSRSKVLSISYITTMAATNSSSVSNTYLRQINGMVMNLNGFLLPFNSTLVGIVATNRIGINETWVAEVRKNGGVTAIDSISINNTDRAYNMNKNTDFNAGDIIQIYVNGSTIDSPKVILYFRRRR